MIKFSTGASLFILAAAAAPVLAQDHGRDEPIEEIHVYGRGLEQIGQTHSAAEGTVGYDDLQNRPILRVGELAEAVPGLIATQHSGGGKANQYFLRGFNLDHGTDFSISFDGVPVNFRSHAHGQGYLDVNFVIPELVERIDYAKGVYRADVGDFSAAGSARFKTYDRLDRSFAAVEIGDHDYRRGVAGFSMDVAEDTTLLAGGEVFFNDGPWTLPEDMERFKGFLKLTRDNGEYVTRISATAYSNEWAATDQIPLRAVESGDIGRFGYIDPDPGGETERYSLTASVTGDDMDLVAYALRYKLNLFFDATYFLNDPINGDEGEQADRRWVLGASGRKSFDGDLSGMAHTVTAGLDIRADLVDQAALFQTMGRERIDTIRDDNLREYSFELWGESELFLSERLRMISGLRGSYYRGAVDSLIAANAGEADATLLQPKLSFAWLATDGVELYASAGRGFHSNDVRGAVVTIDPATGLPADSVPFLVKADGAEVGARFELVDGLKATVTAFILDLGSELVFVGDAGTTEPSNGTRRKGLEVTGFWSVNDWLTLDAEAAWTHSRLDVGSGEPDYVPQSIPFMLAGGADFDLHPVHAAVRLRHFSATPLLEDNSVRSEATTLVNATVAYEIGPVTATLGVYNVFDAKDNDISYYFESQRMGEPAPVEDLHFHPVEPREYRLSLRVNF